MTINKNIDDIDRREAAQVMIEKFSNNSRNLDPNSATDIKLLRHSGSWFNGMQSNNEQDALPSDAAPDVHLNTNTRKFAKNNLNDPIMHIISDSNGKLEMVDISISPVTSIVAEMYVNAALSVVPTKIIKENANVAPTLPGEGKNMPYSI